MYIYILILITHIRGLITPLITTPEPASTVCRSWVEAERACADEGLQLATPRSKEDIKVGSKRLVAEWIHFTRFGIIIPTIKLKVYTFWGLHELSN